MGSWRPTSPLLVPAAAALGPVDDGGRRRHGRKEGRREGRTASSGGGEVGDSRRYCQHEAVGAAGLGGRKGGRPASVASAAKRRCTPAQCGWAGLGSGGGLRTQARQATASATRVWADVAGFRFGPSDLCGRISLNLR